MKKTNKRLYVIQKYVWAKDAKEALKIEKGQHADDIYMDNNWKAQNLHQPEATPIGFTGNK